MIYLILIASVILGALAVLLIKPKNNHTRLLLSFSGAYLLSVTILHLLPEVYSSSNTQASTLGLFILGGIIIQSILESFSKGAEHGHIHLHTKKNNFPILLFVSLCVHAFSEGVPIHDGNPNLLWAIVVHKIPIAIVLTSFLITAKFTTKTILTFLFVFALMSPLGVFTAEKILFFQEYQTEITAFIIGVFLHISTIILFESSENHKFNLQKFIAIILGILLTVVTLH